MTSGRILKSFLAMAPLFDKVRTPDLSNRKWGVFVLAKGSAEPRAGVQHGGTIKSMSFRCLGVVKNECLVQISTGALDRYLDKLISAVFGFRYGSVGGWWLASESRIILGDCT